MPGEHYVNTEISAKASKPITFNPKLSEFLHLAISEVTGPDV
jgi:hypothetical protein